MEVIDLMKLGLFSDYHFNSGEATGPNGYDNKTLKKLEEAYDFFLKEKCDYVICLGDLIDVEKEHAKEIANLNKIADALKNYDVETRVIMGNHDNLLFDVDEFYSILGEQYRPRNIYSSSKNLIFIDACFFKNGEHYKRGDNDWTNTYYPETDKLDSILKEVTGDVYIFMHQNIDPAISEDHRVSNDSEIRKILKNNNNVKTVFQGHYHPGKNSEFDGIHYVTLPAVCENEKAYYIIEI